MPPASPRRLRRPAAVLMASTLSLTVVALPGGVASAEPSGGMTTQQARSATDFLDSLGVNVHMNYGGTRYTDAEGTLAALRQLGVRHVRNNISVGSKAEKARLQALQAGGIRFDFVVPKPKDGNYDPSRTVDEIAANYAGSTEAVEGPNEYNNVGKANWPDILRSAQRKLHSKVKSTPALNDADVYGPSLVGFKMDRDAPKLGNLTSSLDLGNVHSYPGGQGPESNVENRMSNSRDHISGDRPIVSTETGYHNGVNNDSGSAHPSTTERSAGIYYPRLYLEYFSLGVVRTYGYELYDQGTSRDQEDHFGLFRVDGSPKPAATSIGNLTSILADDGAARGDNLRYELADGDGKADDVRSVLMQKSDGSFYLALWRTSTVATPGRQSAAPQDRPAVSEPLSVRFGQGVGSAETYKPTEGTTATQTWQAPESVDLQLGPDVTLLKVAPDGVTPAPGPTPSEPGNEPEPGNGNDGDGGGGTDPSEQPSGEPGQQPDDTDSTPGNEDNGGDEGSPTPGQSDQPDRSDLPKLLHLPVPDTTNWTPSRVRGKVRLAPPRGVAGLRSISYDVDGTPVRGDTVNPRKFQPGRHVIRMHAQKADGTPVVSAQIADFQPGTGLPDLPSAATALPFLAAALIAGQVGGLIYARRRRMRA